MKMTETLIKRSYENQNRHKVYDLAELKRGLADRIEDLAQDVFSAEIHCRRYGEELRFGKKGSIRVYISGAKKGGWTNFQTGESGNALDLLTKIRGLSFKEALDYGALFLGIHPEDKSFKKEKESEYKRPVENLSNNFHAERIKNIQRIRAFYEEARPIAGTLASMYLKSHRCIEGDDVVKDIRFHPGFYSSETKRKYPTLVAFARDAGGDITACQATYLDPVTAHKAEDLEVKKRSFGVIHGSFVEVQVGKIGQPVFVAEGLETALSLKEAGVKGKVLAGLGVANFKNIPFESGIHVILCKDNDVFLNEENIPVKSVTHALVDKAKEALEARGARVSIIHPPQEGDDFNDVLKKYGKTAIQKIFDNVNLTQSERKFQDLL